MIRSEFAGCLQICVLAACASTASGSDGIGRFYCGREIAKFMPANEASWLERGGRQRSERPDLLLLELGLEPTMVVADIGAGTGYITRRLATRLPRGKVFAVEVQRPLTASLEALSQEPGMSNIVPVLGASDDIRLSPESLDLALMVDTYHELEFPGKVVESALKALKPSGRLVVVEYRAESRHWPVDRLHKMSEAQVLREFANHPVVLEHVSQRLPRQHLFVFRKLTGARPPGPMN